MFVGYAHCAATLKDSLYTVAEQLLGLRDSIPLFVAETLQQHLPTTAAESVLSMAGLALMTSDTVEESAMKACIVLRIPWDDLTVLLKLALFTRATDLLAQLSLRSQAAHAAESTSTQAVTPLHSAAMALRVPLDDHQARDLVHTCAGITRRHKHLRDSLEMSLKHLFGGVFIGQSDDGSQQCLNALVDAATNKLVTARSEVQKSVAAIVHYSATL